MSEFTIVTQAYVSLNIITERNPYGVEKRYSKDTIIGDLKSKLEMITGYSSLGMKLKLLNKDKALICDLNDDEKMLGFYPAEDGHILQVDGEQSLIATQEDPNFKKYELTDDEYAKKKGTVREFKEKMKLGRYADPNDPIVKKKEEEKQAKLEAEKRQCENIKVGDRCQINVPGQMTRLGEVQYVGEMDGKVGYFVGIRYDEPLGKNDGTVDGKTYFKCLPKHGGFVKPEHVTVGDYPEENFDEL